MGDKIVSQIQKIVDGKFRRRKTFFLLQRLYIYHMLIHMYLHFSV